MKENFEMSVCVCRKENLYDVLGIWLFDRGRIKVL